MSYSKIDIPVISRWALKPKRDALGHPIPLNGTDASGGFKTIPFWGGRKQSKYNPVAEDAKKVRRQ